MALEKYKHIHLIGIGGIGLSGIARVLLANGYRVSGSDLATGKLTEELVRTGAEIFTGHRKENISADVDLAVVTSAVGQENPEVREAQALGKPVLKRKEFLEEFSRDYQTIAAAGSHGKTTTTALIGLILASAGLDPTVIVGGIVREWGSNARVGKGKYLVIEADEYDRAFLGLTPEISVVTNVDYDHPDIYPTRADYQSVFGEFMHRTRDQGLLLVCGDDSSASALARQSGKPFTRYGVGQQNDWEAVGIRPNERGGSSFEVIHQGGREGSVEVRISGEHNVKNALAAVAAANRVGVSIDTAAAAIEHFAGVGRRFELKSESDGITIIDDYAHHPSEIRATLSAARERFGGREIWVVFQPHTFSRTAALLNEFAEAFGNADHVIVTEIYAARESEDMGVSGADIVTKMQHPDARFIPTLDQAVEFLGDRLVPGSVLITCGAGTVNQIGERILELRDGLRSRA